MALTQISTDGIKNGTITGSDLATNVDLVDNQKIRFGTGNDLEILHNSSENHFNFSANTFFKGNSGWGVRNSSNQNILQISGTNRTVELYGGSLRVISTASAKLTVRGGIEIENSEFNMTTNGNKILDFETGGTNSVIFRHNPSDASLSTFMKAIHGGAVELYHDADGSKKFETTSTGVTVTGQIISDGLNMGDSEMIKLGSSNDLLIYHNGSDSYVQDDGTGKLVLSTNGARIDLYDNTNVATLARFITGGSVELYEAGNKKFETTSAGVRVQGQLSVANTASGGVSLSIADNAKAAFGASDDLQIYHDGTQSFIKNATGNLDIITGSTSIDLQGNDGSETLAKFIPNGAVELYHDNSKKFETTSDGATFSGSALFPDNQRIKIGGDASNPDLQIYHDGSNTRIIEGGTGDFYVDTSSFIFRNAAGSENLAKFIQDGAVELYHNNNKKFETTNAGINVEGSITADDIITAGALLHEDDTDTLVHFSAANTIQLKTGGSSRLLVNNFGINLENGHLNTNGNRIILGDSSGATDDRIIFGNNNDLGIYHDGTDDVIHSTGTSLRTRSNIFRANNAANNKVMFRSFSDGAFEAYHNGNKKFETTSSGATVTGRLKQTVGCAFRARATSDGQTVATDVATKVNFGTEVYDYGSVYDPSNSRFTAPVDGVYNFSWAVRMGTPTPNTPKLDAEIRVNGNSGQNFVNCGYNQQATNNAAWIGSGDMFMSAGQYAELFVDQNTGSTVTLRSNTNASSANNHLWWTGHLVHAA